jgi:hypothetical protein
MRMHESMMFVLAIVAGIAVFAWRRRHDLAALTREPTPAFLRIARRVGKGASAVCGATSIFLIWAAATQHDVSWLYGMLGVVILALNVLLLIKVKPGRRR